MNIYDLYLEYKAVGAARYENEILIISKEIDAALFRQDKETDTIYRILPFYQIATIVKSEIAERDKNLFYKIRYAEILFDDLHCLARLKEYIDFLLKRTDVNKNFSFVKRKLSSIEFNFNKFKVYNNLHLKEIHLSLVKQKVIDLYDALHLDKPQCTTLLETKSDKINPTFNKLINCSAKTKTETVEKLISDIITQDRILSHYKNIAFAKDFVQSTNLFLLLTTSYPYEDILFDIKLAFEKKTQTSLYVKYISIQQAVLFEIKHNEPEQKAKLVNMLSSALQKYLINEKATFELRLTDDFADLWALELHGCEDDKYLLNNYLSQLMYSYKSVWTQDYAVSLATLLIAKLFLALYPDDVECQQKLNALYDNWYILLFENYVTTDLFQFSKNKEYRTSALLTQVEAMSNDISQLSSFLENQEVSELVNKIIEICTTLEDKTKKGIAKDTISQELALEICCVLGVFKKNLPYVALIIKTYKNQIAEQK